LPAFIPAQFFLLQKTSQKKIRLYNIISDVLMQLFIIGFLLQ